MRCLLQLHNTLPAVTYPNSPASLPIFMAPAAMARWQVYSKAVRYDLLTPDLPPKLWGTYGRLPTQALKVAACIAVLDWAGQTSSRIEIGEPQLAHALGIVEEWRASAHRALDLAMLVADAGFKDHVLKKLAAAGPNGLSNRDLDRLMPHQQTLLLDALDTLIEDALIEEFRPPHQGRGRPPGTRYRAI